MWTTFIIGLNLSGHYMYVESRPGGPEDTTRFQTGMEEQETTGCLAFMYTTDVSTKVLFFYCITKTN